MKEDHRKPYEAPHFESEQPNLRNEDVENAEFLNKNTDKDIGNVRAVGFLAPMEALAKEDDVVNHERSKSIRRFTNFKWVDSIQNSKLGYASPFQRMEDIDDRRRYGKCFMQTNKLPKVDTEEDVKKFETFNEYPLVPSFKLSGIAQPATEFSFKTSTNPYARKINIDEKQYGNKKLYNFECTDPRIKPYNPFASSYGMEPYDQARRNPNNVNNTLEFSSVMFNDDPFKRIKNKYQNKIVT
jgi:hypothetical protein